MATGFMRTVLMRAHYRKCSVKRVLGVRQHGKNYACRRLRFVNGHRCIFYDAGYDRRVEMSWNKISSARYAVIHAVIEEKICIFVVPSTVLLAQYPGGKNFCLNIRHRPWKELYPNRACHFDIWVYKDAWPATAAELRKAA